MSANMTNGENSPSELRITMSGLSTDVNTGTNVHPTSYSPTESCYSLPPPYPSNGPPRSNGNTPTNEEAPPPYPAAEYSFTAPALTGSAINYRMGLTASEKEEISEALSEMQSYVTWRTDTTEEAAFFAASNRIQELLSRAGSRLTTMEKQEYLSKIENIYSLRHLWIGDEVERRNRERNTRAREKEHERKLKRDLAIGISLLMKTVETLLVFSCSFLVIPALSGTAYVYTLAFCLAELAVLSAFMVFYSFSKEDVRKLYIEIDLVFCCISAIGCIVVIEYCQDDSKLLLPGSAAAIYMSDMCLKFGFLIFEYFERVPIEDRYRSDTPYSIPSMVQSGNPASRSVTFQNFGFQNS